MWLVRLTRMVPVVVLLAGGARPDDARTRRPSERHGTGRQHHHAPPDQGLHAARAARGDRRLPLHAAQSARHHRTRTSSRASSSRGAPEDHHAILFLVPAEPGRRRPRRPTWAATGWSCFGETPIPNTGLGPDLEHAVAQRLGPRRTAPTTCPKGTGDLPAGRQPGRHAGPLQPAGRRQAGQELAGAHTVPASTPLLPLNLDLMPAPPDIPCPAGRDRTAVQPGRLAGQPRPALRPERRSAS